MTQYNTLIVKLSNSQLTKLKSGIKNGTEVVLKIFSNVVFNSRDKNEKIIFGISCYELIHKVQGFVNLLKTINRLI